MTLACEDPARRDEPGRRVRVVTLTRICQVVKGDGGFWARCIHCPQESGKGPDRDAARRWADSHDREPHAKGGHVP